VKRLPLLGHRCRGDDRPTRGQRIDRTIPRGGTNRARKMTNEDNRWSRPQDRQVSRPRHR